MVSQGDVEAFPGAVMKADFGRSDRIGALDRDPAASLDRAQALALVPDRGAGVAAVVAAAELDALRGGGLVQHQVVGVHPDELVAVRAADAPLPDLVTLEQALGVNELLGGGGTEKTLVAAAIDAVALLDQGDGVGFLARHQRVFVDLIAKAVLGRPGGHGGGAVGVGREDLDAVEQADAAHGGIILAGGDQGFEFGRLGEHRLDFLADHLLGRVLAGHEIKDIARGAVDGPLHAVEHGVGLARLLNRAKPDLAHPGLAEGVHDLDRVRGVLVPPLDLVGPIGDDAILAGMVGGLDFLRLEEDALDLGGQGDDRLALGSDGRPAGMARTWGGRIGSSGMVRGTRGICGGGVLLGP